MRVMVMMMLVAGMLGCAAPGVKAEEKRAIVVACVGDSITAGSGATKGNSYPDQLQRMLGEGYVVRNFGVSTTTMLKKGNKPYWGEAAYERAMESGADVVVLMLGTNDTKPINWKEHSGEFGGDAREMISGFMKMKGGPRVFICLPPFVVGEGNFTINEAGVLAEIPLVEAAAKELGIAVIDVHGAMKDRPELFKDRVHPNDAGAEVLARTVYAGLTGKGYHGGSTVVATQPATTRGR